MILALVRAANALEPAFDCSALTLPEDGIRFSAGGLSEYTFEQVTAAIVREFEPGCPLPCEAGVEGCYQDDCVTNAGTHIEIDYLRDDCCDGYYVEETWVARVETASGDPSVLTLDSWSLYHFQYGGYVEINYDHTWNASWSGELDPGFPSDEVVDVAYSHWESADNAVGGSMHSQETWDSTACAWKAAADSEPGMYQYVTTEATSWEITQGTQVLSVGAWDACTDVRAAVLDGVEYPVAAETWTVAADADGDGAAPTVDCDDGDPSIHLCDGGIACDGIDQNCDGEDETDGDWDSYDAICAGGTDCDDTDPAVRPGLPEIPYDGIDQDCDGVDQQDIDGDGFIAAEVGGPDCDDDSVTIHPAATDLPCTGVDENCDGVDPCPGESGCGSGGTAVLLLAPLLCGRRARTEVR